MIYGINYCYDPYRDLVWVTFTDFLESCAFGVPIDRRVDMIEVVDVILSGEYKQWLDDF